MSMFLGPIHHWLYNKIITQEKMVQVVLAFNEAENLVENLEEQLKETCGELHQGALEDMIDVSNIHGWLQHQVNIVEERFAYAVTAVSKKDKTAVSRLSDKMYLAGEEAVSEKGLAGTLKTAEDVYKLLNDMLLDGMPCDHVNELVSSNADELIYRRSMCIHEQYYIPYDGNVVDYYKLRGDFVKGMLAGTDFSYSQDQSGNYHIVRNK